MSVAASSVTTTRRLARTINCGDRYFFDFFDARKATLVITTGRRCFVSTDDPPKTGGVDKLRAGDGGSAGPSSSGGLSSSATISADATKTREMLEQISRDTKGIIERTLTRLPEDVLRKYENSLERIRFSNDNPRRSSSLYSSSSSSPQQYERGSSFHSLSSMRSSSHPDRLEQSAWAPQVNAADTNPTWAATPMTDMLEQTTTLRLPEDKEFAPNPVDSPSMTNWRTTAGSSSYTNGERSSSATTPPTTTTPYSSSSTSSSHVPPLPSSPNHRQNDGKTPTSGLNGDYSSGKTGNWEDRFSSSSTISAATNHRTKTTPAAVSSSSSLQSLFDDEDEEQSSESIRRRPSLFRRDEEDDSSIRSSMTTTGEIGRRWTKTTTTPRRQATSTGLLSLDDKQHQSNNRSSSSSSSSSLMKRIFRRQIEPSSSVSPTSSNSVPPPSTTSSFSRDEDDKSPSTATTTDLSPPSKHVEDSFQQHTPNQFERRQPNGIHHHQNGAHLSSLPSSNHSSSSNSSDGWNVHHGESFSPIDNHQALSMGQVSTTEENQEKSLNDGNLSDLFDDDDDDDMIIHPTTSVPRMNHNDAEARRTRRCDVPERRFHRSKQVQQLPADDEDWSLDRRNKYQRVPRLSSADDVLPKNQPVEKETEELPFPYQRDADTPPQATMDDYFSKSTSLGEGEARGSAHAPSSLSTKNLSTSSMLRDSTLFEKSEGYDIRIGRRQESSSASSDGAVDSPNSTLEQGKVLLASMMYASWTDRKEDRQKVDNNKMMIEFTKSVAKGEIVLSTTEEYNMLLLHLALSPSNQYGDRATIMDMMHEIQHQMMTIAEATKADSTTHSILIPTLLSKGSSPSSAMDTINTLLDSSEKQDIRLDGHVTDIAVQVLSKTRNRPVLEALVDRILTEDGEETRLDPIVSLLELYKGENAQEKALALLDRFIQVCLPSGPRHDDICRAFDCILRWPKKINRRSGIVNKQLLLQRLFERMEHLINPPVLLQTHNIPLKPPYGTWDALLHELGQMGDDSSRRRIRRIFGLLRQSSPSYFPSQRALMLGLDVADRLKDADLAVELLERAIAGYRFQQERQQMREGTSIGSFEGASGGSYRIDSANSLNVSPLLLERTLRACINTKDTRNMERILSIAQDPSVGVNPRVADGLISRAILGASKFGNFSSAQFVMDCFTMINPASLNDETCGAVIHSLAAAGRTDDARDVFDRISNGEFSVGVDSPGICCYNGLIAAFLNKKEWDGVLKSYEDLLGDKANLTPNSFTFQSSLRATSELYGPDACLEVLEDAIERGVVFDFESFVLSAEYLLSGRDLVVSANVDSANTVIDETRQRLRQRSEQDEELRKPCMDLLIALRVAQMEDEREPSSRSDDSSCATKREAWQTVLKALSVLTRALTKRHQPLAQQALQEQKL